MNCITHLAALVLTTAFVRAEEDPQPHRSPNGAFAIFNVGDTAQPDHHFEIRNREGRVLLSSANQEASNSGSFASAIQWSADSRFVAFSIRVNSPYLEDTFVYSTRTGDLLRLSTDDIDYQTKAIRWHTLRTLVIETIAPFGGKATEEKARAFYRYRRTIRISESPLRGETLYTSRRAYPGRF